MKFFSYDGAGGGFEDHDTAEAARAEAQGAVDIIVDEGGDGFEEDEIANVCWGVIVEEGRLEGKRDLTEEELAEHPEWFWIGTARLVPVSRLPRWVTVADRSPVPDRPVLLWGTKLDRDDFPVLGRLCSCHGCWIAEHAQEGDEEGVLSRLLGEVTHWLDCGTPFDGDLPV